MVMTILVYSDRVENITKLELFDVCVNFVRFYKPKKNDGRY
jgi:hypothetical protein